MYRAITWKALREGVDLQDEAAVAAVADGMQPDLTCSPDGSAVSVDGVDVTKAIRTPELTAQVRHVASNPLARQRAGAWQRKLAEAGGIVAEGRDVTTVVFPDADVKFYLDASVEVRAGRRGRELAEKGHDVDMEGLRRAIVARDKSDTERDVAPLKRADDAIYIDSSRMTADEAVDRMAGEVEARTGWKPAR